MNAVPRLSSAALLALAHGLDCASVEALDTLDQWLRTATNRQLMALATVARASFASNPWSGYVLLNRPLAADRLQLVEPSRRPAVASVLSLHRSGYVRELGLTYLTTCSDPLVVPFLVLRTDDIVPQLRALAEEGIMHCLKDPFAAALVRALDLTDRVGRRARGGRSKMVRALRDFLHQPRFAAVLRAAWRDADPLVRRAAFKVSLGVAPPVEVLMTALADRDPRVRLWAARTTVSRATNESERRMLLPRLETSRSAWTRTLALRARSQLDPTDDFLETALLDGNVKVRSAARERLRARHPERPPGATRARALAVLERVSPEGEASGARIVGALGALADVGVAADAERIAPFLRDARPSVRREAERTSALLRA